MGGLFAIVPRSGSGTSSCRVDLTVLPHTRIIIDILVVAIGKHEHITPVLRDTTITYTYDNLSC